MDSENELKYLRIRSKKHEILVAPEENFIFIMFQNIEYVPPSFEWKYRNVLTEKCICGGKYIFVESHDFVQRPYSTKKGYFCVEHAFTKKASRKTANFLNPKGSTSQYRVFHLVFTYFKWLFLWNLSYFSLCCKDQNWFDKWQFYMAYFLISKK